ncbi:hypothetical protein SADUNF_Sadunf01G0173500 [Salix dunnii]|uniref:Uncharacterized protein n=1 Tax=Salix dunnii TaxID=1413687 RepID=A0A835TL58_9ROSI|nr:hypothetical protein SADUNF_Sadunf01G0173500 [Salix dunnii]
MCRELWQFNTRSTTMSTYLRIDCRHLLSRIFVANPTQRIMAALYKIHDCVHISQDSLQTSPLSHICCKSNPGMY